MPNAFGSVTPMVDTDEVLKVTTFWTGAGASDLVKVRGKGVTTCTHSATGKFVLTVTDWPGVLIDAKVVVHRAAGTAPLVGKYNYDTVSKPAAGSSSGTIEIEFWDLATPSKTNPASSEPVSIELTFGKTK
jgi:hypothetical protein